VQRLRAEERVELQPSHHIDEDSQTPWAQSSTSARKRYHSQVRSGPLSRVAVLHLRWPCAHVYATCPLIAERGLCMPPAGDIWWLLGGVLALPLGVLVFMHAYPRPFVQLLSRYLPEV
jgi:hypothetical protein